MSNDARTIAATMRVMQSATMFLRSIALVAEENDGFQTDFIWVELFCAVEFTFLEDSRVVLSQSCMR